MEQLYTYPVITLANEDSYLVVRADDVQSFKINHTIKYHNILRKWSKLCVSYDFQKNQAQVALSGRVSELIIEPETMPNFNGWGVVGHF